MKAILTGAAGFIGFHTALRLLNEGWQVLGIDNLNDYYQVDIKETRLAKLNTHDSFKFIRADISDVVSFNAAIVKDSDADVIVHLAAQAGVRYSIENPAAYVTSNVMGQITIFEAALKLEKRPPVVYASSSSVYGANDKVPFSEIDPVNYPVSVYAATKRSGELLAASYKHIHGLHSTGLRFFTVYGPFGRPDMAPWLFTSAILKGEPIRVFNNGKMQRDFTYVDDIVSGVLGAVNRIIAQPRETAPIYNLGNNQPVMLDDFISTIEKACGKEAIRRLEPMPASDVPRTYADISLASRDLDFNPQTPLDKGIPIFVEWFRGYNGKR